MGRPISLDGVQMRVASTGAGGEVNTETLFTFVQDGSVVSTRYAGGAGVGYAVQRGEVIAREHSYQLIP